MKKAWKWILGIVIVLVIVAAVGAGVFFLRNHMMSVASAVSVARPSGRFPFGNNNGTPPSTNNNGNPPSNNGQQGRTGRFPGMMPFGNGAWGGRGMVMRGPGMMGFGMMNPLAMMARGLFSLGLLALLVLVIVWLVRSLRKPAVVMSAPAAAVAPAVPVAATHPCPKCSESVQEGWKFCPHCGEAL